jgi:hypothetical protein
MTNFQIIDPAPGSGDERPRDVVTAQAPRPLPGAAIDFEVRPATEDDIPWIDALQRESNREARALGFWSLQMFAGYIAKGNVWIAQKQGTADCADFADEEETSGADSASRLASESASSAKSAVPSLGRLGYLIAADTYFKREDVGVIYQMNIAPGSRGSFVASHLLRRVWDTWPWGVKLCGLWCAQDLKANYFWEKCGFKPIAFRAGSPRKKVTTLDGSTSDGRVHLYWQKRIRAGDGGPGDPSGGGGGGTPYWYPSKTGGGAMREDRVVFPMPPEVHWSKAAPRFLPGVGEVFEAIVADRAKAERDTLKLLAAPETAEDKQAKREAKRAAKRKRDAALSVQAQQSATMAEGGLSFGPPPPTPEQIDAEFAEQQDTANSAKAEAAKDAKRKAKAASDAAAKKNHPVLEQMARTLRDRWVEAAAPGSGLESRLLGGGEACYDVSRQLEAPSPGPSRPRKEEGRKRVTNARRLAA